MLSIISLTINGFLLIRYILWLIIYFGVSLLYRYALNANQQKMFEERTISKAISSIILFQTFVMHCKEYAPMIPLNFILAFYVAQVVTRWWSQWNVGLHIFSRTIDYTYKAIPWPDEVAFEMSAFCPGNDNYSRLLRRTVLRKEPNFVLILFF